MTFHLADASIWGWAERSPQLAERLAERVERGELATCTPIMLEVLYSARDQRTYDVMWERFRRLPQLDQNAQTERAALGAQRTLSRVSEGAQRIPADDFLIAGIAQHHGAVLWHNDRHLDRICRASGQPQEYEGVG